jgi:hypothetical protein
MIYMKFHTRRSNMPMSLNETVHMYIVTARVHMMFYMTLSLIVLRYRYFPKVCKWSYLCIAGLWCCSFFAYTYPYACYFRRFEKLVCKYVLVVYIYICVCVCVCVCVCLYIYISSQISHGYDVSVFTTLISYETL